jgi:hypothetical protein
MAPGRLPRDKAGEWMVRRSDFSQVNSSMLKYILGQNGWKTKANSWMILSPSGQYLLLPKDLKSDEELLLIQRLADALENLNQIDLLYSSISNFKGLEDIIRIASEVAAPPGLIKLRKAERYYKDLNSVVNVSYKDERKKSAFGCQFRKFDSAFMDTVHAGQTRPGSYAVDVHFELSNSPSPPLGRRTAMRVHLVLGHLEVFQDRPEKILATDIYEKVYTSRICRSVAKMIEGSEINAVKTYADINSARPDLIEYLTSESFISEFPTEAIVENIGRVVAIADGIPEKHTIEISGFVHTLRDPSQANSDERHQIRIKWARPKSDPINVSVYLSANQYRQAISAHANRREVRLSGYLIRRGTHYYLEDAINFELNE